MVAMPKFLSPKSLKAQAAGLHKKTRALFKLLGNKKKLRKMMKDETLEPHIHLMTLIVATIVVAVIIAVIAGIFKF